MASKKLKNPQKNKGKRLHVADHSSVNTNTLTPAFCLEYLSCSSGSLNDCDAEEKKQLIEQLASLCKMTWNEIISSGRKGLGCSFK